MKRSAWIWALAIVGAAVGMSLARPIWDEYRAHDRERVQSLARQAEAKARYDKAAREADAARSEAGGEESLRRRGFMKPAEVPLR